MTIEQLKAAIERRGYIVRTQTPLDDAHITFEISRGNGLTPPATPMEIRTFTPNMLKAMRLSPTNGVLETLPFAMSAGQHHMACARCGEPLLYKERYVRGSALAYGVPLEQVNRDRMEQKYRSAKAGPDSSILVSCPRCHQALTTGSTKEIDDQFSDDVARAEQDLDRLADLTATNTLWDAPAPTTLKGLLDGVPDGGKNEDEC